MHQAFPMTWGLSRTEVAFASLNWGTGCSESVVVCLFGVGVDSGDPSRIVYNPLIHGNDLNAWGEMRTESHIKAL